MTGFTPDDDLPEELRGVANRLRLSRPTLSPIDSDRLKLRAMSQAEAGSTDAQPRRRPRSPMVSRWLTLGLTTAILGGTAATGLATCGNFFGHGQNAAYSQYQPGHPCDWKGSPWPYGSDNDHECGPAPTPPPPHHDPPPPPPPPPPPHYDPPPPPPPHYDPPPSQPHHGDPSPQPHKPAYF